MVDIDTGFGSCFGIERTIKSIEQAGAAAIHIEDQVAEKRCGHRPGKAIVTLDEMVDRIKSAVNVRKDLVIMARTDGLASEGMESCIKRCIAYIKAGADMLFPEAFTTLEEYKTLSNALKQEFPNKNIPILANITEFGKTPLFTQQELANVGVSIVLYPLSAHRAMAKAADNVYKSILEHGHQKNVIHTMQTRKELYEMINYHQYEETLDKLISKK